MPDYQESYHPNQYISWRQLDKDINARLAGRTIDDVRPDDPVWLPIVHALAAMCHALVSTGAPLRIALGGGVIDRQPELVGRIEAALIGSLGGYQTIPPAYLVPPALGSMAGPMGSIALEAVMDLGVWLIHPMLDEHLPQAVSV